MDGAIGATGQDGDEDPEDDGDGPSRADGQPLELGAGGGSRPSLPPPWEGDPAGTHQRIGGAPPPPRAEGCPGGTQNKPEPTPPPPGEGSWFGLLFESCRVRPGPTRPGLGYSPPRGAPGGPKKRGQKIVKHFEEKIGLRAYIQPCIISSLHRSTTIANSNLTDTAPQYHRPSGGVALQPETYHPKGKKSLKY